MDNPFTRKSWRPYAVGAAIGVLSWFSFATADRPIGVTTAFENTAGLVARTASPGARGVEAYLAEKRAKDGPLKIDWEWTLVLGVLIGSTLSAALSGDRTAMKVPPLWEGRFGPSVPLRFVAAFLGGALLVLGARLAQGCTSGHGISGALQLAVSSWLFVGVIFATGTATAFLLYGRAGADHV